MKRASIIGVWLFSVACAEEEPERIQLTLDMGQQMPTENGVDALAPPTAPVLGEGLTISFGRPVHWIEVERCENECDPIPFRGYCMFGSAFVEWETAMGVDYEGKFDDVLRGEPKITGPIVYGELPANAGWQSDAAPLMEGEIYAINAYVYEACDDGNVSCVHDKAVGCRFFTIENGQLVDITGEEN
jgi:hypothetical protein